MARGHCVDIVLERRGTMQRWLARELDISDSYLSFLLSGDKPWTNELKDRVAQVLMIPRAVLFFEDECSRELHGEKSLTTDVPHA